MHGVSLSDPQVALIAASPSVNDEFSSKIAELERRLQMNDLDYRSWDMLTDHQQNIFVQDLFLSAVSAESAEEYVRHAVDSCGCPDVMEELSQHSPALLREIEKQQELSPDLRINLGESLDYLIDSVVGSLQEMSSPAEEEEEKNKGCVYEADVLNAIHSLGRKGYNGIRPGNVSPTDSACDDSTGADGDFYVDDAHYNLEIKLGRDAQMGGTSVAFYPNRPADSSPGRFVLVKPEKMEEPARIATIATLEQTADHWVEFIQNLKTDDWSASSVWDNEPRDPDAKATPFKSTERQWADALQASGGRINLTGDKAVHIPASFVRMLYASKSPPIDYIQIGGAGLFHLTNNPASLPVPQLEGEVDIELRPGKSGAVKVKGEYETGDDGEFLYNYTKSGEKKKIKVKKTTPSDTGDGSTFIKASGPLRAQARLQADGNSPFTLDDPDSIRAMMDLRSERLGLVDQDRSDASLSDRDAYRSAVLDNLEKKHLKAIKKLESSVRRAQSPERIEKLELSVKSLTDRIERVRELFAPKEGYKNLHASVVQEAEGSASLTTAPSKSERLVLSLPKFVPTEAWGNPASMSRQQIGKIFGTVGGGGSIKDKFQFLEDSLIGGKDGGIKSPRRILGNLILLESLTSVIRDFTSSAAGFVFEGFIAALLGGSQSTERTKGGTLAIEDLIAFSAWEGTENVAVSLKLLTGGNNIHGSFTNLIEGLNDHGTIVYIVGRKLGDRLSIESFDITRDNFVELLMSTIQNKTKEELFSSGRKNHSQVQRALLKAPTWEEKYVILQQTSGYSAKWRKKKQSERDAAEMSSEELPTQESKVTYTVDDNRRLLSEASGGDGGKQWSLSVTALAKSKILSNHQELGNLPSTTDGIVQVAELYADKLSGDLSSIFESVASLSENVNAYFTYPDRSDAISSAKSAIDDTEKVASGIQGDITAGGDAGSV
jgi:hypothetical protein